MLLFFLKFVLSRYHVDMNFKMILRTTYSNIPIGYYFDEVCPKCGSKALKTPSSYKRLLTDLGHPGKNALLELK